VGVLPSVGMSGPPVVVVSTYPPDHCGVGRDAFQMVEALRAYREVSVLADRTGEPPLADPSVHEVWRKGDLLYALDIADRSPRVRPSGTRVAHVLHHFFLYGGVASVPTFPLLVLLLRLRGYRVLVQFQSVVDPSGLGSEGTLTYQRLPPGLARFGLGIFYRAVARWADAVAVCTPSMRSLLLDTFGLNPERVWLVPVGWQVPAQLAPEPEAKAALGLEANRVVLFHGFLDPTKGLEELIAAFARLAPSYPDAVLLLAGEVSPQLGAEGPRYLAGLVRQVEELGLASRVRFSGYLDNDRLARTLATADVIVLPYTMLYSHGGSAVLSRVAGLGKPLVASRISRFSDELVDGETALLVPPSDPVSIERAVRVIFDDPARGRALGDRLARHARERGWDATARLLDQQLYPRLAPGAAR
jgi:glycosyltransferase involved in cell wall biosynthesis